jgi:hypothetical protein
VLLLFRALTTDKGKQYISIVLDNNKGYTFLVFSEKMRGDIGLKRSVSEMC